MNLKVLALGLSLLATPLAAGERIENDQYELPDLTNPAVHIICVDTVPLMDLLDNFRVKIDRYMTAGEHPDGCVVFYPVPFVLPEHYLDHLYVTNDNKLFGIVVFEMESKDFWTYIDGHMLVKGNQDTF